MAALLAMHHLFFAELMGLGSRLRKVRPSHPAFYAICQNERKGKGVFRRLVPW